VPLDPYFSPVGDKLIDIGKWEGKMYEEFHKKLKRREIPYFEISKLEDTLNHLKNAGVRRMLIIAADETIRPFRVAIRYWDKVSILKVESKFGLVKEFTFDAQSPAPRFMCDKGECWFSYVPEDLGVARDILYFYYTPINIKVKGNETKQVVRKVREKRRDFERALFHAQLMSKALKRAKSIGSEYDLVLVLIDGPLLPPHLDPHVGHGTKLMLDVWRLLGESEMEKLLEMKEFMLRTYLNIFEQVLGSGNIVLVGAVKRSRDQTLQYRLFRHIEEERYDIDILISYLKGGECIGPYFIDRLFMFAKELRRFNIERVTNKGVRRKVPIHSYIARRFEYALPIRLDVIMPDVLREMERGVVNLLANFIVTSNKHTYIAGREEGILLKVPTLFPIYLVDKELDKLGELVENMYRLEIKRAWEPIKHWLVKKYWNKNEEIEIGYFKELRDKIKWDDAP
jgi:hypothetical protein